MQINILINILPWSYDYYIMLMSFYNALILCSFGCNNLIIMVANYVELNIVHQSQIVNKSTKTFGRCNKQLKVGLLWIAIQWGPKTLIGKLEGMTLLRWVHAPKPSFLIPLHHKKYLDPRLLQSQGDSSSLFPPSMTNGQDLHLNSICEEIRDRFPSIGTALFHYPGFSAKPVTIVAVHIHESGEKGILKL